MALFEALGLDWRILTAQFINFAVLVFLLWKFGYKPMLKFLDDRKSKIEAGIRGAEQAEKKLAEISETEKKILKNAKKEALEIIEKSKIQSEENKKKTIEKAREEVGRLINEERKNIQAERAELFRDVRKETALLIASSLEKILEEKIDSKKDIALIKKNLDSLK